jgi:hypothetical protein
LPEVNNGCRVTKYLPIILDIHEVNEKIQKNLTHLVANVLADKWKKAAFISPAIVFAIIVLHVP